MKLFYLQKVLQYWVQVDTAGVFPCHYYTWKQERICKRSEQQKTEAVAAPCLSVARIIISVYFKIVISKRFSENYKLVLMGCKKLYVQSGLTWNTMMLKLNLFDANCQCFAIERFYIYRFGILKMTNLSLLMEKTY